MRTAVKTRILFLLIAISTYTLGFNFLPETVNFDGSFQSIQSLAFAVFGYFVFLPIIYWFLIIKANKQKPWKLLLIFSLSGACARFSFPENIAVYFEFLMWVKYPVIAVVVVFELYLMYTIVKSIWGARKSSGDPRLHTLAEYQDDDKKLTAALPFAWEPASWYYAIPRFSRNHLAALSSLKLKAASRVNYFLTIVSLFLLGGASYFALVGWSEVAAILVACFIVYGVIFMTARYRVARHYSLYISGDKLIVNNSFWGLSVIELEQISQVDIGHWARDEELKSKSEQMIFGDGKLANLAVSFKEKQTYHGMLGQFPEQMVQMKLCVEDPRVVKQALDNMVIKEPALEKIA